MYSSPAAETKATSYRYVVALSLTPYAADSTEVTISTVQTKLENRSVVNSGRMENPYLHYSIFEAIQSRPEMEK